MGRRPRDPSTVADDNRCERNDGRRWRCSAARSPGKRYCRKHNLQFFSRSKNPPKLQPRVRVSNEAPAEVKKEGGSEEIVTRVMELGEVWAFPEESDGFPRAYARIDRFIPIQSLVEVTPLNPHPISEEEMMWSENGLLASCGMFQASESTVIKEISAFAYRVEFELEEKGSSFYRIFPKKGEIWAIFMEWVDLERKLEFKLVEILSDFSEEVGVSVAALVKDEGSSGFYRRQLHEGFQLIQCFSRLGLLMFSHRVPAVGIRESGGSSQILWKVSVFLILPEAV